MILSHYIFAHYCQNFSISSLKTVLRKHIILSYILKVFFFFVANPDLEKNSFYSVKTFQGYIFDYRKKKILMIKVFLYIKINLINS